MQVVIDAQLLSLAQTYRGAGVSNYSRCLLAALGARAAGTEERVTAFVSDPHFQVAGIHVQRTPSFLQQPLLRIAWEQLLLPQQLRRLRADVVHGLVNVLPLTGATPGVVTVHDLSFMRLPEKLPAAKRLYLARLCQASTHKARQVIAVSQQTADDILHFLGCRPARSTWSIMAWPRNFVQAMRWLPPNFASRGVCLHSLCSMWVRWNRVRISRC